MARPILYSGTKNASSWAMRAWLGLVREWLSEADRLPHIWFDDYLIPGEPWNGASEAAATGDSEDA